MKKEIILIIVGVAIIVGGFYLFTNSDTPKDYSGFFMQELARVGVESMGQPVGGFDAFMFMQGFLGFEEEDFNGVQSLEGVYVFNDSLLAYKRTAGNLVTSAEQTISEKGYRTLLENVLGRLNVSVESEEDIEHLIQDLFQPHNNIPTSADNVSPGSIHNLPVPDAVAAVRTHIASELGIAEGVVIILSAYERDWPDACLGLAGADELCAQVITPGFKVTAQAAGQQGVYHTNASGSVIRKK